MEFKFEMSPSPQNPSQVSSNSSPDESKSSNYFGLTPIDSAGSTPGIEFRNIIVPGGKPTLFHPTPIFKPNFEDSSASSLSNSSSISTSSVSIPLSLQKHKTIPVPRCTNPTISKQTSECGSLASDSLASGSLYETPCDGGFVFNF